MKFNLLSAFAFAASSVLGQVVLHPNTAVNKCLNVAGNVRANGTAVDVFDCNGTAAQLWELNLGSTAVRLANSTFCLDAGTTPTSGTRMKIWQCFDSLPAQQWFLTTDARIALFNRGLCLDLTNGDPTNGNVIQVWHCTDNNNNQVWRNF